MSDRQRGTGKGSERGQRQMQPSPEPSSKPTSEAAFPPQPESLNTRISKLERMLVEFISNYNRAPVLEVAQLSPQVNVPLVPQPQPLLPPPQPQPLAQPRVPIQLKSDPEMGCDINLLLQFKKLDPPKFKGEKDPIATENWVNTMEKLLAYMRCTEIEKVGLATFFLVDEAEYWWKFTKTVLVAKHPTLTWGIFLEAFNKQYSPHTAQKRLQAEFLNLYQGSMTVDQYESKFTALSRFDPQAARSEEYKVERFMAGLRPSIRTKLVPFDISTYDEAIRRAQLCEQDYEFHQAEFGSRTKGKGKEKLKRDFDDPLDKRLAKKYKGIVIGGNTIGDRPAKSTRTDSSTVAQKGIAIKCNQCGRSHSNRPCFWVTRACFRCGQKEHLVKDCPNKKLIVPATAAQAIIEPEKATPAVQKRAIVAEKGKKVDSG